MTRIDGFLFGVTVLIWGTTWFVILGQLGDVHPVVSVAWRFLMASLIMFIICWARSEVINLSVADHLYCLFLGLFLFCINYCLFYVASLTVKTGLISVIFSTMVFWNAVGAWLFLKTSLDRRALIGGLIGVIGLSMLFRSDLQSFSLASSDALIFCLLATFAASAGNLIAAKLQLRNISVWSYAAFGMLYGGSLTLSFAIYQGYALEFNWGFIYVSSFLYLVFFGSVLAFSAYLTLLSRLGPARAAYASVMFPVVAVCLSIWFEDYKPTTSAGVALALVLLGNWLTLSAPKVVKYSCVGRSR